jgi:hypothetical protein
MKSYFYWKTSKQTTLLWDSKKKIWERKRKNGLYLFDQYQMEKYEKIEFDIEHNRQCFMKNKLFRGMEFIFDRHRLG